MLVVDLTTGQKVGHLNVTLPAGVGQVSVAFTHNGQKLAVVGSGAFESQIQIWDAAKGQIVSTFTLDDGLKDIAEGNRNYQGPAVDWLPGDRRLLINGRGIFHVETGTMERILPATTVYRLQPLGEEQLLIANGTKLALFNLAEVNSAPLKAEQKSLVVASAPPKEMSAAKSTEKSDIPMLTPADRSQSTTRELSTTASWSVEADPGPVITAKDLAERLLVTPERFPFTVNALVSANGGRAAVGYASRPITMSRGTIPFLPPLGGLAKSFSGAELAAMSPADRIAALKARAMGNPTNLSDEFATEVEHVSLTEGGKTSILPTPYPVLLQCLSPSGGLICTKACQSLGRLDIWDASQNTHAFSFEPYTQMGGELGLPVVWADFISDDQLLTLGPSNLTLWQLPDCRAVWEVPLRTIDRPVLSSGREYLAIVPDNGSRRDCLLIRTANGQTAGQIQLPSDSGDLTGATFSTDGKQLALVSKLSSVGRVTVFDLLNGQPISTYVVPESAAVAEYCGSDYLLVEARYLIHIPTGKVVWRYESLDQTTHMVDSPDDRHWYIYHPSSSLTPRTLVAASIPDADVRSRLVENSQAKPILEPGGSVALDVELLSPSGDAAFGREFVDAVTEQYKYVGISVAPASPVRLVVRFIPPDQVVSSPRSVLYWSYSLYNGDRLVWREVKTALGRSRSASDPQAIVDGGIEAAWESAKSQMLKFEPPYYVFDPDAKGGRGKSVFKDSGPKVDVK